MLGSRASTFTVANARQRHSHNTLEAMPRGTVKWFSIEKGYGFIAPNDGGRDVFVHRNNVASLGYGEGLRDGEEVEYQVEQTPKGLSAVNVESIGSDSL